MYHYTYLIKDKHSNMKYIGVRSSKCHPKDDTDYWGSSRHLPTDVKYTHKKRVLSVFKTRLEAINHEIQLHNKYDVASSPSFYNKAKQTSTGFDTSGTTLTKEHLEKVSRSLKGRKKPKTHGENVSKALKGVPKSESHKKNCSTAHKLRASHPDYVNPRKGVPLSDDTKAKISKTKKDNNSAVSVKNPRFSPWFIVIEGSRTEYFDITKSEFALQNNLNPDSFRSQASRSKGINQVGLRHLGKCIVGNII